MQGKNPRKSIALLVSGYSRFISSCTEEEIKRFKKLAIRGQQPHSLVLACSDSRVDPAIVLDCDPGDLFVVRNVANLVPPCETDQGYHGTSAALEFAICHLNVRQILLLGHTKCGGIRSLFEEQAMHQATPSHPDCFVHQWMKLAYPARDWVDSSFPNHNVEDKINLCSQQAMRQSLDNLMTFPWIQQKVADGKLDIDAWQFDLEDMSVLALDRGSGLFVALPEAYPGTTTVAKI